MGGGGGRVSLRIVPVTSVSWGLEREGQDGPEESSRHLSLMGFRETGCGGGQDEPEESSRPLRLVGWQLQTVFFGGSGLLWL